MSITGSLVGYENSDDLCNKKNRSLLNVTASSKQCTSLNSSIITTESSTHNTSKTNHHLSCNNEPQTKAKRKHRYHLNTLWSIWYGVLFTYLQGYLILDGAYRFLGCYLIQWRTDSPALTELNAQIILCGFALLMLPLFFISAIFKIGNLANDGVKLASSSRGKCSAEPEDGLEHEAKGGTMRAIWTHGGPTSAFIHIVIALCLLIPRLLLESKLIENGNLSRESIWHTELDFMVPHRDRLVILSITNSPYQNDSIQEENHNNNGNSNNNRATYFEDDDELSHTHLIEKFHSGTFDESDYFDTHEKLENEKTTLLITAPSAVTEPNRESNDSNKVMSTSTSTTTTTTTPTTPNTPSKIEWSIENANATTITNQNNNNRKQNARMKNRNNGMANGRGTNRKHSNANRERTKEKNSRRGDDGRESFDIKQNNKFELDKIERETNGKFTSNKKYIASSKIDTFDEFSSSPPDTEYEISSNRKSSNVRDSNIHVVKPADGIFVPSTPFSTDSKIIEIKPSTIRTSKRVRRSIETRIRIDTDDSSDDNASNDEDDFREPKFYVNLENNEEYAENEDANLFKPVPDVVAAALIDTIPVNVSTSKVSSTSTKQLDGFAGCLQHYLNVNKEIDTKSWTSMFPSFEFMNFVVALIVWSSRYPSVFWSTSKSFSLVFSIQMIANAMDLLLVFAGVSVIYKLQIVGQKLPLQTPPLLLNGTVSLLLYILSILLTISSSLILYLYGHGRLSSRVRDRRMISTKTGDTWAYFAHCASLCFILALAVVKAPLMHDFSAIYKGSLDGAVLIAALSSVMHIFFWILLWLGLTAKRRWDFKLPPLDSFQAHEMAKQPLLMSPRVNRHNQQSPSHLNESGGEETIYWPKLAPNSPKLKVTFNDVPSTLSDNSLADEQDGKRNSSRRTSICMSGIEREIDEGEYATLRPELTSDFMHFTAIANRISIMNCDTADDTSEEGKLLDCVRDDSVTYASTRDLEPPMPPPPMLDDDDECDLYTESSTETLVNPVSVTVHSSDNHCLSQPMNTRTIRRGDSGMNDALTPCTESTSTECSTSPPERAASDSSSSGIHSGEEREEVVIRPKPSKILKPAQPAIQEEPFGRSTNMVMSSFNTDLSCATLPAHRAQSMEPQYDFANHCNTMPLPINHHQQEQQLQQQRSPYQPFMTPNGSKTQLHTTLPNGVRYANPSNCFRRVPLHVQMADSPYGVLGLGAGHHTFSKFLHDPLTFNNIIEDRDSANYSMISDQDRDIYANALSTANIH